MALYGYDNTGNQKARCQVFCILSKAAAITQRRICVIGGGDSNKRQAKRQKNILSSSGEKIIMAAKRAVAHSKHLGMAWRERAKRGGVGRVAYN